MARLQHKSFNPSHFKSNENESSSEDSSFHPQSGEVGDKIITKGDHGKNVFNVDLASLERDVIELLKYPDVKISNLVGANKEKYDRIRLTAQMLYDSEYYKCFFDRISKHCNLVQEPIPGTVGGYLCGCLASKNFPESRCAPLCADGLAYPKESDQWKNCNRLIINAEYRSDVYGCKYKSGYVFTVVNEHTSDYTNPAFIFVNTEDLHGFKGFTVSEKTTLEKMNVTYVRVFGTKYTESGLSYPQFYPDVININDVKMRGSSNNSTNNSSISIVVAIIIILLILIFLGWSFRNSK